MKRFDPLAMALDGALVEASAGTGKTYAITTLVLRLVIERGIPLPKILVVTFTRAATAELRDRIRARLRTAMSVLDGTPTDDEVLRTLLRQGDAELARRRLSAALRDFDEASISTIHGFCQRVLATWAFESGARFDAELVTTVDTLLDEIVADFWASRTYEASRGVVEAYASLNPTVLRRVAGRAVGARTAPLLPSVIAITDLDRRASAVNAARDAVRPLLAGKRGEILTLITGGRMHERLRKTAAARLSAVEAWLDEPTGKAPSGDVDAFTTAGLAKNTLKNGVTPRHPFFDSCDVLSLVLAERTQDEAREVIRLRRDMAVYARSELASRSERLGRQSFEDLLHQVHAALIGPRGDALATALRGSYQAALVDEFQDTDPVQYEIFRRAFGTDALFLVGDPKQAIYSFRGADVYAYLAAAREVPDERRATLGTSWRSDPVLVAGTNALFGRVKRPFLLSDIEFPAVTPAPNATERLAIAGQPAGGLSILFVPREGDTPLGKEALRGRIPSIVADDIARVLTCGATIDGRPVTPGDLAVLVRKNDEAVEVQRRLRDVGVPSVQYGDRSVLDSDEAGELSEVLLALAEPGNVRAVRAAMTTSLFGVTGDELARLDDDEAAWETWGERFRGWHDRWRERGFFQAFRRMLDEADVPARLLSLADGERRLTNVLHLAELVHEAAAARRLGMIGTRRWLSLVRRSASERAEIAAEATQLRLESDAAAVKLITIHQSKGLEYPITWVPYAWDGRLLAQPDKETLRFHDDAGRLVLDVGSDDKDAHETIAEHEAAAENLRLLYVAITRARHRCTLVWASVKDGENSPLGYLLHQPSVSFDDPRAATAARIKTMDDDAIRADLDELSRATLGAVSVTQVARGPRLVVPPAARVDATFEARRPSPREPWWFRTSSFSRLAGETALAPAEEEGRDRDAGDLGAREPAASSKARIPLWDLPRGRATGDVIHGILEVIDYATCTVDDVRTVAESRLARSRMPLDPWRDRLSVALIGMLETPLGGGVRLRSVGRDARLAEMEFLLPVAKGESGKRFTARGLGDVLGRGGGPAADYADRARRLGFPPLEGYLHGFIDLVFQQHGRFYVVDWKSSWLGPSPDDYAPERLAVAMDHHHYVLQYHLYAVALHRWLTQRVPGYDYDTHFGGIRYVFVRGVTPETGEMRGIFSDRPSRATIEGLSALLDGHG